MFPQSIYYMTPKVNISAVHKIRMRTRTLVNVMKCFLFMCYQSYRTLQDDGPIDKTSPNFIAVKVSTSVLARA